METFPKITIITPSYNQGQYIEETILSIINQGYPNLEYIIIDGGSTDNTIDILKKYDKSIAYWVSESDTGQSNAINKGLKVATGEIINWINSDDVLLPGALKKVAEKFSENTDAIIIHGCIQYFGTHSYYSHNYSSIDIKNRYVSHICMPQPSCFFKRELIIEQGLLDENLQFSMDTDLYVRAGLHYKIVQVNDVFAKFRLHENSKSVSSFNKTFLSDNRVIFNRVLATLNASTEINELKKLDLFTSCTYLYNKPDKNFDTKVMLFYFLEHRLLTLFNLGYKKEFKKIFAYLLKNYLIPVLLNKKLIIYRITLFLPSGFLHTLARYTVRNNK